MSNAPEHIDHELLTRYLAGECDAAEKVTVEAWIAASPENAAEFDLQQHLWDLAEVPVTKVSKPSASALAALDKVKARIAEDESADQNVRKLEPKRWKPWMSVAASVMLLLGVFVTYYGTQSAAENFTYASLDVPLTHQLPDGSTVTLNAHSSLTYSSEFGDQQRAVSLRGEAFFDVERDVLHPFVISAGGAEVQVLGTSFLVTADSIEKVVDVQVSTGTVEVRSQADPQQSVVVTRGETASLNEQSGVVSETNAFDPEALYWNDKTIVFEDTELRAVFAVLEGVYDTTIIIESEEIMTCPHTSTYANKSLDYILNILKSTFNLEIKEEGGQILISGDGC